MDMIKKKANKMTNTKMILMDTKKKRFNFSKLTIHSPTNLT